MQHEKDISVSAGEAEELACGVCHGEGEITYNPSLIGDPQAEASARCDQCHGTGIEP